MKKAWMVGLLVVLLSGCGSDDPIERCRWVRFIPEQGESYYEFVCDGRVEDVRYIPEAPTAEAPKGVVRTEP